MKEYRDDIRARAAKYGRNPDDVKVLFLVVPTLAETREADEARRKQLTDSQQYVDFQLALMSAITDIDFSKFDLDQPLPHLTTHGEQGSLDQFQESGRGKTLRQLLENATDTMSSAPLHGTPESVADDMAALMEEVGGDGFLITSYNQSVSRRYVLEVTEGLVPELQRRGLVRTEYRHATLRETLLEF